MSNAKIKRIELVNGSMISLTIILPAATDYVEDFAPACGDVLNTAQKGREGYVNLLSDETDLQVGDEITPTGEIIKAAVPQGRIENTQLPSRNSASDYRDVFAEKHGQRAGSI